MSIGLNTIPAISPVWLDGPLDATGKPSKTRPGMRDGAISRIETPRIDRPSQRNTGRRQAVYGLE